MNTKGWEVEYVTETTYSVRSYRTREEADTAADRWLEGQHPSVDPKVWVRPARRPVPAPPPVIQW
jgi:hypothetical protein